MSILWNFDIKVLLEYDGFLSQIFVVVMNLVFELGLNQTVFLKILKYFWRWTLHLLHNNEKLAYFKHNKIDVWFYFGGCQSIQVHKKMLQF